jgi:SAM-dependent methyltransferase
MRTDSKGYSDYLQAKYLPGRRLYLRWLFYPKLLSRFNTAETIIDLGCGTGEFLKYCLENNHEAVGVDSNEILAERCRRDGYNVIVDSICELSAFSGQRFKYAICDNVLEHLDRKDLNDFFGRLEGLLSPGGSFICIVPGIRGFKCDPTHKTFVCYDLLSDLLKGRPLKIAAFYYHPINFRNIDRYCYLNMQVFEIDRLG